MLLTALAPALWAQQEQQGARPGWPCVPGRAVDPSYLEISESTGGQLFLFQKGEMAQAGVVMAASFTHPATVVRAVGHLSGTREFEVPVDSTMASVLVLASIQCRNAVTFTRPNGSELTAANAAQSIELQAGRIVRVDGPEPGKWKVRLTGTGLFVLGVLAKTPVALAQVSAGRDGVEALVSGEVSDVKFQLAGPSADVVAQMEPAELREDAFHARGTPPGERFRVLMRATDAGGWPVLRTHPVLFRKENAK